MRAVVAEALGTGLLVMAVLGSGIAASRLSVNDAGLQLFENAAATAAALVALILAYGPVSGAHFNPVITLVTLASGGLSRAVAAAYIGAQFIGGALGAIAANAMYALPPVTVSAHERAGGPLLLSELIATAGLVLVVFGLVRSGRASAAPYAVGAYIGGAYFFTSSTSFANPAVTLARVLSDTFAGIAPASAPGFIGAQLLGGLVGFGLLAVLYPRSSPTAVGA